MVTGVACTPPQPVSKTPVVKDTTRVLSHDSLLPVDTTETMATNENDVPEYLVNDNPPYAYNGKESEHIYGVDYEGDSVIYTKGKKILKEGEVEGEFVEIQSGDYLHLILKDKKGWYHYFWVMMDNIRMMDYFWQGYEFKRGQKLRVYWKREKTNLPEAGIPMVLYKMVEFKVLGK